MRKGSKMTLESREKMREAKLKNPVRHWLGKKRPDIAGENCYAWKGGLWLDKNYVSWIKNRRNRLKKVASGSHTFVEWERLKALYHWTCPHCWKKEPEISLTEDHIIPLSLGGSDDISNLQPLCNSRKWNKII